LTTAVWQKEKGAARIDAALQKIHPAIASATRFAIRWATAAVITMSGVLSTWISVRTYLLRVHARTMLSATGGP